MAEIQANTPGKPYLNQAVEIAIRLSLLAALVSWCFLILKPFIPFLLWGAIIAVTVHPIYEKLKNRLGGRGKLASFLISGTLLAIVVVPCVLLAESLMDGIQYFRDSYQQGGNLIPPPDQRVESWPPITKPIVDLWRLASHSIQSFVVQYEKQLAGMGRWLLKELAGIGIGIVELIVAVIISGVMLVNAKSGGEALERVLERLAGNRGKFIVTLSRVTIRQVVKGILGVAIIQTTLASIGFFVAGIPAAGLWAVICLVLAIVQIGIAPVVIPLIIYMFSASDTLTASLFLGWSVLVLLIDNVLKPLLLGRGAPVPMLVIFLGSIGGFVSSGFIGLFLGAVILSLTYKLAEEWLLLEAAKPEDQLEKPASE